MRFIQTSKISPLIHPEHDFAQSNSVFSWNILTWISATLPSLTSFMKPSVSFNLFWLTNAPDHSSSIWNIAVNSEMRTRNLFYLSLSESSLTIKIQRFLLLVILYFSFFPFSFVWKQNSRVMITLIVNNLICIYSSFWQFKTNEYNMSWVWYRFFLPSTSFWMKRNCF